MDWKRISTKWLNALPWLVGVVVIFLFFSILYKSLPVITNWKPFTDLINILVWPVVVVVVLLTFRKPLAALIASLVGRVTKLSVFQVSIELATLPRPPSPWSDPSINILEKSEMPGGHVDSSGLMGLFEEIGKTTPWDYFIFDIKEGHSWFISRVFIFTVFLQAMRGVKCVVFVESKGDCSRRLIGLALPDAAQRALSEKYSWLGQALLKAMINQNISVLTPSLDPMQASRIIDDFIKDIQVGPPGPMPGDAWTQLGTQSIWEHTEWLTRDTINKYLRKALYEWDSSHYKDTPAIQTDKRTRELVYRKAPFIALVNSKEEFQGLLDRQKLLEQVVPLLQHE